MAASAFKTDDEPESEGASLTAYVELLHAVERAQRQLHDTVAHEMTRAEEADITAVQAMLLFHLGDERLTAAEIMQSGRYLGSNVSYNLKKLNEAGRLETTREDGKGAPRFGVTDSGRSIQVRLWALFRRQRDALKPVCSLDEDAVTSTEAALKKLERYWLDQVRYRL
jgi:DNA-binding MarR family transcriptional regulator